MFEVNPSDAAAIQATAGASWRPLRTDKNLKRLAQDKRRFMDLLRAVANVHLRAAPEKTPER
ncbi:MAG TPA: hypothetical protein VII38_20455, partial [Polyangia bacterium]